MKVIAVTSAAALAAGVALGYFLRPEPAPADKERPSRVKRSAPIADSDNQATIVGLRMRIADLERRLREKNAADASAVAEKSPNQGRRQSGPGAFRSRSMRENLERMRREDPERYVRTTNFIARSRAARIERDRSRREYFSGIGTVGMSATEREAHEQLQQLLAQREELELALQREDLSDEQREELFGRYRDSADEIRRLNATERETLLRLATDAMGLADDEATEAVAAIKDIFEATGSHFGPPRPPRDGGRR